MTGFTYLLTEGVHDVAFLGKLLSVCFGARQVETMEELDDTMRVWMGSFKWPLLHAGKTLIRRLAVPAPAFFRLPAGELVCLRNAQGITELGKTLSLDLEAFARTSIAPGAIGIVLDSDDEPQVARYAKLKKHLVSQGLQVPDVLAVVSAGSPRVGVFALPEPGVPGTLEDVLLALGDAAYADLAGAARDFAMAWHAQVTGNSAKEWKEIKKPAGIKKATLGAMTAVLKPGRAMAASLEDNRWVSDDTRSAACLAPCLAFLRELIATGAPRRSAPEASPGASP
jgi:hypothetical protein